MNKHVKVGNKIVGEGNPVFIVVELGVCHEQNVDVAKHFVEVAKEIGADAVKVEAFQADDLVMDRTINRSYGTTKGVVDENYYDLLKRLELSFDQIREIKKKADELDILFFSTVHDKEDTDFFEELGVCAYKISSIDLTHLPLIKHLCTKGKPVLMDTGGAYLGEIDKSLRMFQQEGFNDLILMHNPSEYPSPIDKTNLRIIPTLQQVFDVPVGLSCHTAGMDMSVVSVALGANVIEKPITRDNAIQGPEHIFAFLDTEAKTYVEKIRNAEACLGSKRRVHVDAAAHARAKRRGIYVKKDLPEGHILLEEDLIYRVPNLGISSEDYENVIGKKLIKACKAKDPLKGKDIDG